MKRGTPEYFYTKFSSYRYTILDFCILRYIRVVFGVQYNFRVDKNEYNFNNLNYHSYESVSKIDLDRSHENCIQKLHKVKIGYSYDILDFLYFETSDSFFFSIQYSAFNCHSGHRPTNVVVMWILELGNKGSIFLYNFEIG